jgi:hypothetical protein
LKDIRRDEGSVYQFFSIGPLVLLPSQDTKQHLKRVTEFLMPSPVGTSLTQAKQNQEGNQIDQN